MSKDLEALETLKDMLIGNGVNDNINDYVDNLILPIKQALTDYEAIDNATPSEAINFINTLLNARLSDKHFINVANHETWLELANIKQTLLKAQEPKHYLQWEDLEFTRDEKVIIVKMGDTVYKVLYRCCDGIEEVQLLSEDEKLLILNLIGKYKDNIQVFNDLHLERVE